MGSIDVDSRGDLASRFGKFVVSPEWLAEHLGEPDLKVVETPWKAEGYARAHIEGAVCLPWHPYLKAEDENGNRSLHVMGRDEFAGILSRLGIREKDRIVAYDDFHNLFSTRFWWVCRLYGFHNVRVLDGGWQRWLDLQLPMSVRAPEVEDSPVLPLQANPGHVVDLDDLCQLLDREELQIWDTRRTSEYDGSERTSNRRRGHLPGAVNLEWKNVLQEEPYPDGPRLFRPPEEIAVMLEDLGLERDRHTVTHCQAGIRAAFGAFVLEMLGFASHSCYDASMAEWANLEHTRLV